MNAPPETIHFNRESPPSGAQDMTTAPGGEAPRHRGQSRRTNSRIGHCVNVSGAPSDSAKPRSSAPRCRRQSSAWPDRGAGARRLQILVSGKATKYRLPEQPGQCVPTILATACVGQNGLGQTEYVVRDKPATQHRRPAGSRGTRASSGGRNGVEQHPIRFTPWVRHRSIQGKMLISESRRPRRNSVRYPVAGLTSQIG